MKALVISKQGAPVAPNVSYTDFPDLNPPPPGCVTVKTLASALNHLDLWVGKGVPGLNLDYPRVAGCDACGIVEAVGDTVDESWIGKKVILNAAIAQYHAPDPADPSPSSLAPDYELIGEHQSPGTHAERFNASTHQLAVIPDEADPAHAAAFGLVHLTAWSMMIGKADLKPGQSVLITGIGGGVATAALAIARHLGCTTCVTSRHESKLERARQFGADHTILDDGSDWSRQARAATNKRGFDLAVDSVGKATHLACIKSLARGGAYVTPGCTTGPDATTDLARIFWNQLRILGSTMGTEAEFAEVAALFSSGALKPVIDSAHQAPQGRDAYERLESGQQFGKVVITWT